jgi:hypothetical protein
VADLAGPPPGEDLQQDHAHGLRVAGAAGGDLLAIAAGDAHLLTARQPEQRQRGGDLREGVIIDVVAVVEGRLMRNPGDLPQPAGGVGVGDGHPRCRHRPEGTAGFGLVGGHEGEQVGDGSQIVVDQPGVDLPRDPAMRPAVAAVGWIGVPPAERRGLARCCGRVGQDLAGIVEGDRQPPVKPVQAPESFLADGGPPQRAGLQHRAQVPLDRLPEPRVGDQRG